jgi:uncharacterized protein YqeY
MDLQSQLMADLKVAMRERDDARKGAIRMALAALKNARVDKNADLTEEEMLAVLAKEVRQRHDSLSEYEKAGREDLVAEERAALDILEVYMPQMLSEDEIADVAREVIGELGATSPKEMGQVMREMMSRVKGRADGRLVNQVVRQLLAK